MGKWSMAEDRELMKLARADLSAEKIAARMARPLLAVVRAARRLGVRRAPSLPRPNGHFKAKVK